MLRRAWILAVLFFIPLAASSNTLIALLPNSNGGLDAFVTVGTSVFAVPIDANGVSHPERAVRLSVQLWREDLFGIGKTGAGWLATFSDPASIGRTQPLAADFSPLAESQPLGRDWPTPLVCSGDVCAYIRQIKRTLVIADATGAPLAELPIDANWRGLSAAGDGFALLWTTRATDTSPFDLHIELIDRTGRITGSSVIATRDEFSALNLAPHPLGAAVFIGGKRQIDAQVVRSDGTIAAQASYLTPDLEVASISAATNDGQIAVAFNTFLQYGSFPQFPGYPARYAAYAMRVSESLAVLEGPVTIAPGAASSAIGPIVASNDAFFAIWSDSAAHMLRIPLTGPIDPSASVPFDVTPRAPRRRSVTP